MGNFPLAKGILCSLSGGFCFSGLRPLPSAFAPRTNQTQSNLVELKKFYFMTQKFGQIGKETVKLFQ
jgi:hypothetical protein